MDERTPEIERPGPDEPMSLTPTPRASATSVRVAAVAGSQWGVINLRQLNACGVSGTMVSRWVAEGRLHRLHRGVYAVGHRAVPIEGRLTAALFFAGAGAALSHATAAWWWWLVEEEPAAIHISVPHRRHPTGGVELHHPRRLDRVWHRRLPVTTVSRTLLDLAAGAPTRRLRRALAQADFHRRLELDAVDDVLRRGHAGSQALRQALARHRPQLALARSELEERFLTLCESGALPIPELNAKLHGLMVDVLWPSSAWSSSSTDAPRTARRRRSSGITSGTCGCAPLASSCCATPGVRLYSGRRRCSRTSPKRWRSVERSRQPIRGQVSRVELSRRAVSK